MKKNQAAPGFIISGFPTTKEEVEDFNNEVRPTLSSRDPYIILDIHLHELVKYPFVFIISCKSACRAVLSADHSVSSISSVSMNGRVDCVHIMRVFSNI